MPKAPLFSKLSFSLRAFENVFFCLIWNQVWNLLQACVIWRERREDADTRRSTLQWCFWNPSRYFENIIQEREGNIKKNEGILEMSRKRKLCKVSTLQRFRRELLDMLARKIVSYLVHLPFTPQVRLKRGAWMFFTTHTEWALWTKGGIFLSVM